MIDIDIDNFLIDTTTYSEAEVGKLVDLFVELGAEGVEGVERCHTRLSHRGEDSSISFYRYNDYTHWGVIKGSTFTTNLTAYQKPLDTTKIITIEDLLVYKEELKNSEKEVENFNKNTAANIVVSQLKCIALDWVVEELTGHLVFARKLQYILDSDSEDLSLPDVPTVILVEVLEEQGFDVRINNNVLQSISVKTQE